jgi:hypothetical protein
MSKTLGWKRPDHRASKFTYWLGVESSSQRLPPYFVIFALGHEMKRQFVHKWRERPKSVVGRAEDSPG